MGDSEEKADLLDLLLRATNDGIVDWDFVAGETHYNERWRFLLGWDELNTIVENATVVVTHSWSRVAELSLQLAPQLPLVPCVAGEIAQVVMNLVTNAAQAIGDKAGSSGRKGQITVETLHHPASDSVEIRVTDDGVGIPDAIRAKIFDPFFTTRPVGQGSGQGLAQVHTAVVGLHGGTVHFDSRPGEGTRFVVRLPLGEAEGQEETLLPSELSDP